MAPQREEYARELASNDGSSDDPLGSAQPIDEQVALFPRLQRPPRQWTQDAGPVQEAEQDCTCGRSLTAEFHAPDCPITAVDARIARVEEAVRQKINEVWSRLHSFRVTPWDSCPHLIESAVAILDSEDGEQITFNNTISATTAHEHVAELARMEKTALEA
jgi:hypothetical protein